MLKIFAVELGRECVHVPFGTACFGAVLLDEVFLTPFRLTRTGHTLAPIHLALLKLLGLSNNQE